MMKQNGTVKDSEKICRKGTGSAAVLFAIFLLTVNLFSCTTTEIKPQAESKNEIESEKAAEKSTVGEYSTKTLMCPFDYTEGREIITEKELEEDLEALTYLFTQAYVLGDDCIENGFNINSVIEKIREVCNKEQTLIGSYYTAKVLNAVSNVFTKELPVNDGHFAFGWHQFNNSMKYYYYVYFSSIYFQKKGNDFFVYSSDMDSIKPGMKYTGNEVNLYKCLDKVPDLYRFGIYINKPIKSGIISVDDERIIVPVQTEVPFIYSTKMTQCIEDDDTLFLELSTWLLGNSGNPPVDRKDLEIFNQFIANLKRAKDKKNVIIDLSSNSGGFRSYVTDAVKALYFSDNEEQYIEFAKFLNEASKGTIMLNSSLIFRANKRNTASFDKNDYYDPFKITRYFIGKKDESPEEFPQYKGEKEFNGNLYIIVNKNTASASEMFIAMCQTLGYDKVKIIGENTLGCITYGGVYSYYLPNSGIYVRLCSYNQENSAFFKHNKKWNGELKGFEPDYWCEHDNLFEAFEILTGNKNLVQKFFEKGGKFS